VADTFQLNGNRIHALVTADASFRLNGARIHALVTADASFRLNGARIHALVEGPLTPYAPVGGAGADGVVQGERLRRQAAVQGQRLKPWAALKP
jgi:hypothetical protein